MFQQLSIGFGNFEKVKKKKLRTMSGNLIFSQSKSKGF